MKPQLKPGQKFIFETKIPNLITSDKNLIRNILFNLFSNAIKFSESSTSIHISSILRDNLACISIRDEGIGISEEDKTHLFSSFFRGRNVVNIQGTGLGLHIVKKYIDLLGGSITLDSNLGKGTKIVFTIPIKE